jgi:hypothetical protein
LALEIRQRPRPWLRLCYRRHLELVELGTEPVELLDRRLQPDLEPLRLALGLGQALLCLSQLALELFQLLLELADPRGLRRHLAAQLIGRGRFRPIGRGCHLRLTDQGLETNPVDIEPDGNDQQQERQPPAQAAGRRPRLLFFGVR